MPIALHTLEYAEVVYIIHISLELEDGVEVGNAWEEKGFFLLLLNLMPASKS